jgi:integrase
MRARDRLSAAFVKGIDAPGKWYDGGGLLVDARAAKGGGVSVSYQFRFQRHGSERTMGLGATHDVTLKRAREKADEMRRLLADGRDPIQVRDEARSAARAAELRRKTFGECVTAFIEAHDAAWRTGHATQWRNSMRTHAKPIWDRDVATIDTPDVLTVIEPIWHKVPITADRIRKRVDEILAYATARGHRPAAPSPARWKGHLDAILPPPRALKPVVHHPALPYADAPALYGKLIAAIEAAADVNDAIPEAALALVLLTATRSIEARGAKRSEIDAARIWTVPSERMKKRTPHRVPLSAEALALLKRLPKGCDLLFAMNGRAAPITKQTLANALARHAGAGFTVHGLRASFRTWADECTAYPHEIKEFALAHVRKSQTERAYARSDLLAKRARLMQQWADHLARRGRGARPRRDRPRGCGAVVRCGAALALISPASTRAWMSGRLSRRRRRARSVELPEGRVFISLFSVSTPALYWFVPAGRWFARSCSSARVVTHVSAARRRDAAVSARPRLAVVAVKGSRKPPLALLGLGAHGDQMMRERQIL